MAIPQSMKLIIAVGGIFGAFSYFALLQEDLFKTEYAGKKFKSTFFMMVAERGVNAVVALVFIMVLIDARPLQVGFAGNCFSLLAPLMRPHAE
jgi:hypothetical protein